MCTRHQGTETRQPSTTSRVREAGDNCHINWTKSGSYSFTVEWLACKIINVANSTAVKKTLIVWLYNHQEATYVFVNSQLFMIMFLFFFVCVFMCEMSNFNDNWNRPNLFLFSMLINKYSILFKYRRPKIGIQMYQKEPIKTFMMITNWKKPPWFIPNNSA